MEAMAPPPVTTAHHHHLMHKARVDAYVRKGGSRNGTKPPPPPPLLPREPDSSDGGDSTTSQGGSTPDGQGGGTPNGQSGTLLPKGQSGTRNGHKGVSSGLNDASNGHNGTSNGQNGTSNGQNGTSNGHNGIPNGHAELPLSGCIADMESVVNDVFATVASLKEAYIRLQAAHAPYDLEKLQSADRAVIVELRRLSELKHGYRDRHSANLASAAAARLQADLLAKDAEIARTSHLLSQTSLRKDKLERKVKRLEQKLLLLSSSSSSSPPLPPPPEPLQPTPPSDSHTATDHTTATATAPAPATPDPPLFESVARECYDSSCTFAKLLTSLMKESGWDLSLAADSIEPGIAFSKPSHKRHAFESYLCHQLMNGFDDKSFHELGPPPPPCDSAPSSGDFYYAQFKELRTADPVEFVSARPNSLFGRFCRRKFLESIHPKMESAFFGGLSEHRRLLESGKHPTHAPFYRSFLLLAKSVWLLHRLAFALEPPAAIFQVRRGAPFSSPYMESVAVDSATDSVKSSANGSPAENSVKNSGENSAEDSRYESPSNGRSVGFTVFPGFQLQDVVVKCKVYISHPASES